MSPGYPVREVYVSPADLHNRFQVSTLCCNGRSLQYQVQVVFSLSFSSTSLSQLCIGLLLCSSGATIQMKFLQLILLLILRTFLRQPQFLSATIRNIFAPTSILIKSSIFQNLTLCSPMTVSRRFGGAFRLQTTRHYITENTTRHSHHRRNLRCNIYHNSR